MRFHGIQLQGIRAPRGEHRVALDPGYSLVVTADAEESRALLRLVEALLYPTKAFGAFADWIDPEIGGSARAGLSFSLGASSYRVIADFQERRLALGSYAPAAEDYEKISTDPKAIAQHLARAGLPGYSDFQLLCLRQAGGETERPPVPSPRLPPASQPVAQAPPRPTDDRPSLVARARRLRHARERLERLEAEEKELVGQQSRDTDEPLDDLDGRIEGYRERSAQRAQEIAGVEAERRLLLDERSHLAAIPAARASGTWLGVALGAAGALAGTLVHPAFYLAGLAGVIAAITGLVISRRARRRLGTVEARLAGMRVREATIERRFESETAPLRSLLRTLGVASLEELSGAATRQRELAARLETLRAELERAREEFSPEAAAELGRTDEQLAEAEKPVANEITQILPAAPETETARAEPVEKRRERADWPERLVSAGERVAGGGDGELRARLTGVLPIYLRAFTGGEYTRAWYGSEDGWSLRRERDGAREPWSESEPELRPALEAALQFALLEVLATQRPLVLFVGPMPVASELDQEGLETLSRALRRLAGVVQVIQFSSRAEPWEQSAALVQRLSA